MTKKIHLRKALLAAGLLLLAGGAGAQQSSLLWKVTAKGAAKPTFIFGTIHALPQSKFFFPKAAAEALNASDRLVLEIDMDDAQELSSLPALIAAKGKSIKDFMTPEELEKVSRYMADSAGIPFEQVAALKPFVFTSLLLSKVVGSTPASYEEYLLAQAKQANKPIDGIETVAEQVEAFDRLPFDKQVKQLVEMISDMSKTRQQYQQMVAAYTSQQLDQIAKMSKEENKEYPEFDQVLITDRNTKWIPRLKKKIDAGSCFIAVGAGHLPGSNGILELLKKKGYTVEPVAIK
ncbi:TraB/GumN family protein [uncultured Acetobacteroides sp.]|uniref:TraB/GumN family protein n=1 Tax=uncultured Acetobacteroides sp. TaxID=1760811 RepID=UPI0029F4E546|nr:TraB/GumN family protein [uncultured Acetobacteroides sp.]